MDSRLNQTGSFVMILDDQVLRRQCEYWSELPFLALDTEFMRVNTFYPKLALVQVNDGEGNYLIDPLQIQDWEPFKTLMQQESVTKVFHSCSEDLLVFVHYFGLLPAPLFDTQIANAFLDRGFGLSYQNLVADMIGDDLPKGETRSDWLQRPLSEKQLQYAALDVAYLPDIYRQQCDRLDQADKLEWVLEDCQLLLNNYREEQTKDFSRTYRSFGAAWQLSPRQLGVLKALAAWRETRARERDKPRNWIIRDKLLFGLARRMPTHREQLFEIDGMNPNFVHYEGDSIVELVKQVQDLPEADLPPPLPRPMTEGQKKSFRKIRKLVEDKAESLSLPVEILGRKRLLTGFFEAWQRHRQLGGEEQIDEDSLELPAELQGWRREVLLPDLLELMS